MATNEKPQVDVPSDTPPSYQLELEDISVGEGDEATSGRMVEVHYVGVSWTRASSSTPPGTGARRFASRSARVR